MKKEKSQKIDFFRKIYLSIFKIKEYELLSKEGLKRGIGYIIKLILIFSAIYGGIIALQMKKNANDLRGYLEQNLPKLTYLEGVLTSDNEETVVLDDFLVKVNFGGQIVIDTKTEYEILINKYKQEKEGTIILTSNMFTTINGHGEVIEYTYPQILKQYLGSEIKSLDEEELLYLFDNISYTYYFTIYAMAYCILNILLVSVYDILVSIIIFIVTKIKKVQIKFSEIFIMSLYSMTIPIMGFFVMNFIPATIGMYVQFIITFIPIVYLTKAIYVSKWITPEMEKKK